jgi:hypothetical protein
MPSAFWLLVDDDDDNDPEEIAELMRDLETY